MAKVERPLIAFPEDTRDMRQTTEAAALKTVATSEDIGGTRDAERYEGDSGSLEGFGVHVWFNIRDRERRGRRRVPEMERRRDP